MDREIKVLKEIKDLDNFLYLNNASIFLYSNYLNILKDNGWHFEYLTLYEHEKLVSVVILQYKKFLKPLPFKYYQVTSSPVGLYDRGLLDYLTKYLKKNAFFANMQINSNYIIQDKAFVQNGHDHTYYVDLTKDVNSIFNNFSKTYRNIIRRAIKEGVVVEISEDLSFVDELIAAYHQMTNRKNIEELNSLLMKKIMTSLISSKKGIIVRTLYNDKSYNYAFIAKSKETARYLYGASLHVPKNFIVGQHLHFEVIKYLKKKGFKYYDLGGVKSFDVQKDDDSYGVFYFKKNFGGNEVRSSNNYKYYKNFISKFIFKNR